MQQPNIYSSSAESGSAVTHDDDAACSNFTPVSGTGTDSSNKPEPQSSPSQSTPQKRRPRRRFIRALVAIEFLLAIMVRIFIGVILLVLPWSPLWDNNQLLRAYPHVAVWLSYGAVRGIISGLGLLNLWIAIDDTLHRGERHV